MEPTPCRPGHRPAATPHEFRLDVGEADETEVRRVLSMWRNFRELTPEQVAEVVAHFAGHAAGGGNPVIADVVNALRPLGADGPGSPGTCSTWRRYT